MYQLSTMNSRLIPFFHLPLQSWEGLRPPLLYTKLTCYPVSLSCPPPSDPDLHGTHLQVFCCLTYDLCPLESPSTLLSEFYHDPPSCSPGPAGSPSPLPSPQSRSDPRDPLNTSHSHGSRLSTWTVIATSADVSIGALPISHRSVGTTERNANVLSPVADRLAETPAPLAPPWRVDVQVPVHSHS